MSKKQKEVMIFKYNEDDILEMLIENLAQSNSFGTFNSKAVIIGTPGKDLRLIAVVGDIESDLNGYNFENIDNSMNFNGDHSGEFFESCQMSKTEVDNKEE